MIDEPKQCLWCRHFKQQWREGDTGICNDPTKIIIQESTGSKMLPPVVVKDFACPNWKFIPDYGDDEV